MTAIETLGSAAIWAPSGDNTQPWRLELDAERGSLRLQLDETRDRSPMNAGQRMARIALGAALENVEFTAQRHQWSIRCDVNDTTDILVSLSADEDTLEVPAIVRERVSNRRIYDAQALSPATLDTLRARTVRQEGVDTHWLVSRSEIDAVAQLVARADAVMFGDRFMRRAFLANVRFDAPATEAVEEGLSLASLELSAMDRFGLRMMRGTPDTLLRLAGTRRVFAAHARQRIASASGICVITAPGNDPPTDVNVGRAFVRAWLAMTAAGLQAQPMMSLPVLDNALANGAAIDARTKGAAAEVLARCNECFASMAGGRLAAILRFGNAPPPSGRCGRRPLPPVFDSGAGKETQQAQRSAESR